MVVTASPNPLVEWGPSDLDAIIQVETSPSFAGDQVDISSSQLLSSCGGGTFEFVELSPHTSGPGSIQVFLDDDGNATVVAQGTNCAPGSDLVEADLMGAPYTTAVSTLVVNPPVVTPEGVTGYPNPEVETGDTTNSGDSTVYAVFYVETNPVYAEQPVEISSTQLSSRCGNGNAAFTSLLGSVGTSSDTALLDDDGNTAFVFAGNSCAAGDSDVIADVLAWSHPTYVTTYTILPPAPTI